MKTKIAMFITIGLCLLIVGTCIAETITFEPYTDEEKPYLIDGGTHDFAKMVADFGAGFTNNHFRFADMAVFWIYKFEFDKSVIATAKMDLGAEYKVSIAMSDMGEEGDYVKVLEEKNHVHDLKNKGIKEIKFTDYFKAPSRKIWIKFEDSIPADGWGPYLDSFTLEYTLGQAVESTGKLATIWSKIKGELVIK
jgi:hypothetical protein